MDDLFGRALLAAPLVMRIGFGADCCIHSAQLRRQLLGPPSSASRLPGRRMSEARLSQLRPLEPEAAVRAVGNARTTNAAEAC
jgi:hypothetical protein